MSAHTHAPEAIIPRGYWDPIFRGGLTPEELRWLLGTGQEAALVVVLGWDRDSRTTTVFNNTPRGVLFEGLLECNLVDLVFISGPGVRTFKSALHMDIDTARRLVRPGGTIAGYGYGEGAEATVLEMFGASVEVCGRIWWVRPSGPR
jgi:hypothetical protein